MNQPQPVPSFSLAPETERSIAILEERVPASVKAADAIHVQDDRTEQLAVNARSLLKQHEKDADVLRDPIVRPHNAFVKEINARFKTLTDAIGAAVTKLDNGPCGLLAYRREKQRRIDEENRRIASEVERQRQEAEGRAADEARAAGNFTPAETQEYASVAAAEVPAPVFTAPAPKVTRTGFAAAGAVSLLDFEVTDLAALAAALPEALEVKRKPILDHGRYQERAGQEPQLAGVRFFRREGISER